MTTRILVIQDSPTQSAYMEQVLRSAGFEVEAMQDAKEGLQRLRSRPPFDLLLVEEVMHSLGGHEVCRRVKTDRTLCGLPVLLISSHGDAAGIFQGLECGADDFILKPFEPHHLISRIRSLLATRASRLRDSAMGGTRVMFRGETFEIDAGREQILDFMVSIFDDYLHAQDQQQRLWREQMRERLSAEEATLERDQERRLSAAVAERAAELEAALASKRESERRFRLLAESGRVIPWEARLGQGLTYVGPQVREILGYRPEDLLGTEFWGSNLSPEDPRVITDSSPSSGDTWESEFQVRAADGRAVWLRDHASLIRSGGGTLSFRGFMFDITQLKTAEATARESHRFLSATLDALSQSLAVLDENGTIIAVNAAWRAFGAANGLALPGAGVGTSYLATCDRAAGDESADLAATLIRRGQGQLIYPCHSPDTQRWFEMRVTRFQGSPIRTVVSHEDITARCLAEMARHASEVQLSWLLEQMPVVVWSADRALRLTVLMGGGLDRLGLSSAAAIGLTAGEVFGGDFADQPIGEAHYRALQGSTSTFLKEWSGRSWESVLAPLPDSEGGIAGVLGLATDVTDRRATEQALEETKAQYRQAQKMEAVGRLAGGIAHDFNNLLTAISGYSGLLIDHTEEESRLRRYASQVHKAAAQATELTRQLLAFSRKQVLAPVVLSLNSLILDLHELLKPTLGGEVSVEFALQDDLGQVRVDPGQLNQVLLNLAINASDAMSGQGLLRFRTQDVDVDQALAEQLCDGFVPGRYVRLSVTDNGSGMEPQTLEHIFEPFYTTKAKEKGTGLGLSMVYGIVKQSGGWILCDSQLGEGTSFHIYLPRLGPQATPEETTGPAPPAGHEPSSPPAAETILLAEDDPLVRQFALEILQSAGYLVLESSTPEHALEIAEQHSGAIDLLLTDVIMPRMNGVTLSSRARDARPDLPVLFMSGHTGEVLFANRKLHPDDPLLAKPFSSDSLLRMVRRALDEVSSGRQPGGPR